MAGRKGVEVHFPLVGDDDGDVASAEWSDPVRARELTIPEVAEKALGELAQWIESAVPFAETPARALQLRNCHRRVVSARESIRESLDGPLSLS